MSNLAEYNRLLASKAIRAQADGITPPDFHSSPMKDFQKIMTKWAIERGRDALFANTGLGKTLMQLEWARAMGTATKGRVLGFAPLAVAQQSVGEAEKFGIDGVGYARDQSEAGPITLTNYDRLDKFDLSEFGAVFLDESSIIKSVDGKFRAELTDAARAIPYRLCCSATPAPNDYVELGQHAEFLGVLTAKEMLSTWFVHDGSGQATNVKNKGKPVAQWRLKGHAEDDFWRWVASWAMMVRKPSDLGCDDTGYDLPPLYKHQVTVPVEYTGGQFLFDMQASTLSERLQARKKSIDARCRAAAEIVARNPDETWLIWCHLNAEELRLTELIPGLVAVRGSDAPELKTQRLLGFARGEVKRLCSKPTIAGLGMNFQVCSNMIFVGLNDSFEQLYQAIRRCWRFGQTKPVNAYMIASELEGAVVKNLDAKEAAYVAMGDKLAAHIMEYQNPRMRNLGKKSKPMGSVPAWLQ